MANMRREDLQMKLPALLHLSRLGYGYLSGAQLRRRDRETNILPDALRSAAERINHVSMTDDHFAQLMREIRAQLDAEDLGKQFYSTIRNGWNGLRLIDFEHPENNQFRCAAELACGYGAGSFRPDITLFVNGLPLAMIEVKTRDRGRGLRSEYDRMQARFRGGAGRRYLQCAQVWAFSDDHADDPDRLLPYEGNFYTSVVTEEFPVYAVLEKRRAVPCRLLPRDAEEERRILEDAGFPERPRSRAFRQSLSPQKPVHRMMTALFFPERFLFLLRYGVRYVRETDPAGEKTLTRRILTTRQLSVLRSLAWKAKRGFRNWTAPSCGAAGEQAADASMVLLLRDLMPEVALYWVSAGEAEAARDREALQACGISCAGPEETDSPGLIHILPADREPKTLTRQTEERGVSVKNVYILPPSLFRYGRKAGFTAALRRADPSAVFVSKTADRIPESAFPAVLPSMEGNEQAAYFVAIR